MKDKLDEGQIKRLLKQREKAVSKTAMWLPLLKEAYRHAIPNRNPWEQYTTPGASLAEDIYDVTLVDSTNKFVNAAINAIVPPKRNFLKLVSGTSVEKDQRKAIDEFLQEATRIFFTYLRRSNFDQVIAESFYDVAISTGVLQLDEGEEDDPFIFCSAPADKVSFRTGARGEFNMFCRDWDDMSVGDSKELWGDDFQIPERYHGQDLSKLRLTLHDISWHDKEEKVYKYAVIDKATGELCFYKEDKSWSWIAFRMNKMAGEDRGRGKVLDCLPAAMSLNKAMYDELAAAGMQANPAYMAYTDSIINPFTFAPEPNTVIPVRPDGSGTWPIAPLPQAGNPQFGMVVAEDLRNQIREIMLSMPAVLDSNSPVRTATDTAIRDRNNIENKVATFGRLQQELFPQLVKRGIWILQKKGLLPPFLIDDKIVAIRFETPLAQSSEMIEAGKFVDFFNTLSMAFGQQAATGMVKAAKVPQWLAEKMDTQLELVNSEKEIDEILQQGRELIEQQQQGGQAAGVSA